MPRVALWFFAVAPIYVLIGMSLGIYMGASEDMSLFPAHAHINLIGWVTMALYGTFYALARDASRKLAWTTFWLNNIGIVVLFPSLVMVLKFGPLPGLSGPARDQRISRVWRHALLRGLGLGSAAPEQRVGHADALRVER